MMHRMVRSLCWESDMAMLAVPDGRANMLAMISVDVGSGLADLAMHRMLDVDSADMNSRMHFRPSLTGRAVNSAPARCTPRPNVCATCMV